MLLTGDRRRTLDAAIVAWVIAWIALGFWVGREVRELGDVTNHVRTVGGAVIKTGESLGSLDDLPVVGGALGDSAADIRGAGEQAVQAADETRSAANRLALLLGLAVALVPTLPLLALYLPARTAFERDRRAISFGISDELLARRAVANLPLHVLRSVSDDPLTDIDAGRYKALADAERKRLGL